MDILNNLKKNDKVQNQLALYYLFEYGKQTLQDNYELSGIKEQIEQNNKEKNPIFTTEYIFGAIDIAKEMSKLSVHDLSNYIYSEVKEKRKQERGR